MGTRGAIVFVVDGAEKGVYNQFDSYPDGLGIDVLTWLRMDLGTGREDKLRELAHALRPVNGEPTDEDRERYAEFGDPHVSTGRDWYSLLRRTQGEPGAILRAGVYEEANDFPLDSLFCEWAYVIDFDTREIEVYEGFQRVPPDQGRYAGRKGRHDYYPVRLRRSWSFDALPTDDQFVAFASPED